MLKPNPIIRVAISIIAGFAFYLGFAWCLNTFIGGLIGAILLIPLFVITLVLGKRLYEKLEPSTKPEE